MTKETFIYGLNACSVTYHNGQKLYEHDELVKCFEDLGIFEQEPKTGRWIYIGNSEVNGLKICKCSNCEKKTYGSHKFCPNCGAKMEESEETE